ncbi:MAG: M23 family metallopeptidase [Pseudomonadota bacterium]
MLLTIAACTTTPHPPSAPADPLPPTPAPEPQPTAEPERQPASANEAVAPEPRLSEEPVPSVFPESLSVCPLMTVSNRPNPVDGLTIVDYAPIVEIEGVDIAVAPVEAGCLSSGFGPRGGRLHKGIDLHTAGPVDIYSGADGTIVEKLYRDDYGNMLVIDHGGGVFTRYAHLERFEPGLETGSIVTAGQVIGVMGSTASYRIPRHLHYEVLTGEWGARAGSFALTPVDPFSFLP